MPVNLNLLPTELSVSKSLGALLKTLRAVGVIAVAAFLVFGIGVAAYFIVVKVTLDGLNTKVTVLKNQVTANEQSEQQVILLKDRLAKISSVQNLPSLLPNLSAVKPTFTNLSAVSAISQMQVDATGFNLTLNIKTNSDLTVFLATVRNPDVFKTAGLTAFSLNPTTGYSLTVQTVKK